MNRPRIALLTAAHEPEETTRNFRRELDADLVEFHAKSGELPDRDPDAFDGVVVTGSKSSVYWDDDWIPALVDYVADAHDAGVPILGVWEVLIGICLLYRPLIRLGIFLLFLQLPGTFLPVVLLPGVVFEQFPHVLTVEGQYIVKNLVIIGAALVIGGTVRNE